MKRVCTWYVREVGAITNLFSSTDKKQARAAHQLYVATGPNLQPLVYALEPMPCKNSK